MYRVFLVDDEPFIIEGLYEAMDWSALGLEIVGHADHGKHALEQLERVPADIMITDISMPVMNGLECIRHVRQIHPDIKVIILSGYDEFDYLKQGMSLGIENYLLKPVNIAEMHATLSSTVDKLNSVAKTEPRLHPQDISILKDNVLYRWLTNQISPAELEERAEALELDLRMPYVMVAVVRSRLLQADVYEHVDRQLASRPGAIRFKDIHGDTVIVFKVEQPDAEQIKSSLEAIRTTWHESGLGSGEPLGITLGSLQPAADRAPLSYVHAQQAQEYFLVYPNSRILEYEELPTHVGKARQAYILDWSRYARLLLDKNKAGLTAMIEEDFAKLSQLEGVTPEQVHSFVIELLIRFKTELESIKLEEDRMAWFHEGMERVLQAGTGEELVQAMQDVAVASVQTLEHDVKSPIVHQVLSLIHESYADTLTLKSLGAQYHIHPVYLGQLFAKETGESFTDYINRYRIERAKELLKSCHLKVHEIARKVGYWESGYFYKQFKKYVGVSPTDYKELL